MIRALTVVAALAAGPAWAQEGTSILEPDLDLERPEDLGTIEETRQPGAAVAPGAVLRGLDKMSGALVDLAMSNGQTQAFGRLEVTLNECRYPAGNPAGDAFAYVVIRETGTAQPVFEGWMIASSPALNALDHARYDVWVLRCSTS